MAEENKDKFSEQNESDYGFPFVEITPLKAKEKKSKPEITEKIEIKKSGEAEETTPKMEKQIVSHAPSEKRKRSQLPLQFSLVMLILIILSAMAYFLYFLPETELKSSSPSSLELVEKSVEVEEDDIVKEEDTLNAVEEPVNEAKDEDETIESIPQQVSPTLAKAGNVIKVTQRGNSVQYYLIVSSTPSEKVALEQAENIKQKNTDVWVIYPYGDITNYRLSIGQFSTFGEASTAMEKSRAEFGESIWILKY